MTILVLVSCVLFVLLDFLSVFLPLLRFLFLFFSLPLVLQVKGQQRWMLVAVGFLLLLFLCSSVTVSLCCPVLLRVSLCFFFILPVLTLFLSHSSVFPLLSLCSPLLLPLCFLFLLLPTFSPVLLTLPPRFSFCLFPPLPSLCFPFLFPSLFSLSPSSTVLFGSVPPLLLYLKDAGVFSNGRRLFRGRLAGVSFSGFIDE